MKRLLSIFLIFTIILGMHTTSFGAKLEQTMITVTDGMNGKTQQVRRVNLMMGGKDVYTDIPPILYTVNYKSKILVPIRFASELGAKIEWDQEKYEATIITEDKTITLKIDSSTAFVNGKKVNLPDGVPPKLLQYQWKSYTMVPLSFLAKELGMEVNWIPEIVTATVDFPEQSITNVSYDHNGPTPQILIKTTGVVEFNTMYLPGSRFGGNDRLIIDIPNTKFNMNDPNFTGNGSVVKKEINMDDIMTIRGSIFQTQPRNMSRIVIDLAMKKDYQVVFNEALSAIQVEFPKGEKIEEKALNSVKNISLETRNNSDVIVIHTEGSPVYNTMDFGNKMVVDVLNAKLSFDKNEVPIAKGGVKRVRTAQFAPDEHYDINDKIVRVVLDLEEGQSFKNIFVEQEGSDILVYTSKKTDNGNDQIVDDKRDEMKPSSPYSGKIIVIDPGHGGKDPGTSNKALNLVEKELTLDTARRLNDLLKQSGFTTYMTRNDDTTLNLYGRPEVANGLGAAAFVSVHYNYVDNQKVSGIEMLYVDDPNRDCKRFANTLQEEMTKSLNANNRGIKNEPEFVVIRETRMPSVIAEVGFISNPTEGYLISTPEYRQKAAQALFNGIKRYFDESLN